MGRQEQNGGPISEKNRHFDVHMTDELSGQNVMRERPKSSATNDTAGVKSVPASGGIQRYIIVLARAQKGEKELLKSSRVSSFSLEERISLKITGESLWPIKPLPTGTGKEEKG